MAKEWHKYTEEEVVAIQNEVCLAHNCQYCKPVNSSNLDDKDLEKKVVRSYCDYLCMTGKRRDCDPTDCTHWQDPPVAERNVFKNFGQLTYKNDYSRER